MNKINKLIPLSVLLATTVACSDIDENYSGGAGFLALEISADGRVVSSRGAQEADGYSIKVPSPEEFSITLTDATGNFSHTWPSLADFPVAEQYRVGAYTLQARYGSLDNEGFDTPCFEGETEVTITEAVQTKASVVCTVANAMVSISYTDAFRAYFKDWSAELHSTGGAYIPVAADETRPAFLRPGDVSLMLNLTLPSGATTRFSPATITGAKARHLYKVRIDVNNGDVGEAKLLITIDDTMDDRTVSLDLSNDLIAAPEPVVTPVGFTPGEAIKLTEGSVPSTEISMDINARNGLEDVILTTNAPSLLAAGWPAEVNLMTANQQVRDLLTSMGLETVGLWHNPDKMAVVNFTKVIAGLTSGQAAVPEASFTLVVKDKLSKVNQPVTLDIDVESVDMKVTEVSPAVLGVNKATVTVSANSANLKEGIKIQISDNDLWQDAVIDEIKSSADGNSYLITFSVPEGTSGLDARLLYFNRVKATIKIKRAAPEYKVEIDPFASRARVKVTARDASVVSLVTRYLRVFIDNRQASVLERDPSKGLLTILGLEPSGTYRMKTTVLDTPAATDFTDEIRFVTEGTPTLPNSDFEEVKESIKVAELPSGGRYSQNTVEIFNRQNYASFNHSTPVKGWANTNAKTFCSKATNRNTWYMQPSVYTVSNAVSGGYGVALRSVAFDVSGEPIPDYLQPGLPFTDYSLNIPAIESRAAGKLFLGEYLFDPVSMTEQYNEGIAFSGRPMSVNGFYMFEPSTNFTSDRGLVAVEVLGRQGDREITIASGQLSLPLATTYTSFSIPLKYDVFGVKATRLKLMFASTDRAGSLAKERTSVITFDNPETSSSIGSVLTIDNVTLAY